MKFETLHYANYAHIRYVALCELGANYFLQIIFSEDFSTLFFSEESPPAQSTEDSVTMKGKILNALPLDNDRQISPHPPRIKRCFKC